MPKISTERCCLDGSQKQELDFKYNVFVSKDGVFSTTLPKDIVSLFKEANVKLERNRISNEGYIQGKTLEELKSKVKETGKEYLSRQLLSEKIVIKYVISTTCAYVLGLDGEIYPNGGWVKDFNITTRWSEGTESQNSSTPHPFGIQVYAKPFWRRDYAYKSGTHKTEYAEWTAFGGGNASRKNQPNLAWLEATCSIVRPELGKMQEIEYTEPIAYFFVNLLKSICKLNEKIKNFVTPEMIGMLADKKLNLLN